MAVSLQGIARGRASQATRLGDNRIISAWHGNFIEISCLTPVLRIFVEYSSASHRCHGQDGVFCFAVLGDPLPLLEEVYLLSPKT